MNCARLFSLILLFAAGTGLDGQVRVSFSLQPLALEEGEQICVRGSFNNWSGTALVMEREGPDGPFSGSFLLDAAPGDTIQYKFVVIRNNGSAYWEAQADPSNLPYFNRLAVLREGLNELPEAEFSLDEYFRFPVVFGRDAMREDFRQMRATLEEIHPALYDYTPKEEMDRVFDSCYARIDTAMEFRYYFNLLSAVMSRIGCGHSRMWIPGAFWDVAPAGLFPLRLCFCGEQVFVNGYYGEEGTVARGSRLLSVNMNPIGEIRARMESLTSADGFNRSFRSAKVEQDFPADYALNYGFWDRFHISYSPPGSDSVLSAVLVPVSKKTIEEVYAHEPELSLRVEGSGQVAIMTINTFSYYDRVDMFSAFMDSSFRVIHQQGIGTLVLDLRGNGGGDPFCSSVLFSYLEPGPVPYFVEPYGKYTPLAEPVPRAEFPFEGKLLTLVDGLCFSTTGHFCALLRYHGIGEFVGTETGATFTCTGNATYPLLEHTRILLGTARVGRYTTAVNGMDPRRGIIPDYPVLCSQEDIVKGTDRIMETALDLAGAKGRTPW
jgi:hypothetical protein